jgi:hypothetical protein
MNRIKFLKWLGLSGLVGLLPYKCQSKESNNEVNIASIPTEYNKFSDYSLSIVAFDSKGNYVNSVHISKIFNNRPDSWKNRVLDLAVERLVVELKQKLNLTKV